MTKQLIENLRKEIGLSYIDVICYQEHKQVFRFFTGNNTTGTELLYMYSCGKPVTVVAAMRLVENGLLSLEDRVWKYLPAVKESFILINGEKRIVGDGRLCVSRGLTSTCQMKNARG